jgi:pimeloyl-ACP methyl ester carboxylesterase
MNHKRRERIAANEISELKTYSIGGYQQKVLIEGKYKTNSIVIFLHGGPGFPIPFSEGCRGMFPEFTERFIMVYWDQLGCGINNCKIDDTFSIDSFVDMTVELVKEIKNEFPENSVSLFGVSWGSVLAAKAAERIPEMIHHVITYGQVLKQLTFNEEVYQALENSNMPAKQRQQLESIKNKERHTISEMKSVMKWVQKYTEGYQSKSGGKTPIGAILFSLLTSPDYSFKDVKAIVINGYLKNKSLLEEMLKIDLTETFRHIRVPYLIMQGDTDIVTSTKAITEFVETVDNNNIIVRCIENSGHMPGRTAMDYIIREGFDFLDGRKNSI